MLYDTESIIICDSPSSIIVSRSQTGPWSMVITLQPKTDTIITGYYCSMVDQRIEETDNAIN